MRPGTGPFASGRMTPEPSLPHIKAATSAAGALPTPAQHAGPPPAAHVPLTGSPFVAAAAASLATIGVHRGSGSTMITDSLPLRHESESSRRSMHAQEDTTASWDTTRMAGTKASARQPLRATRVGSALALALSPATAGEPLGSGPLSARLTALPLPPQPPLSAIEEPASRGPTGPSHPGSSTNPSSMHPGPARAASRSDPPAAPVASADADSAQGDSSDDSVYRSSSSHSSNHMYDEPKRTAAVGVRGKHRRTSSRVSTPVMYELETVLGGTTTIATQPGSFLQPLGGPPGNLSNAGSTAATEAECPRRSGLGTSEDRKAAAPRAARGERRSEAPAHVFAPPAASAHAASEQASASSTAAAVVPAAARSFARNLSAARAASANAPGRARVAGGAEVPRSSDGKKRKQRKQQQRPMLMSSTLGLNTRDSIYCMGPESGTPTHRSQQGVRTHPAADPDQDAHMYACLP